MLVFLPLVRACVCTKWCYGKLRGGKNPNNAVRVKKSRTLRAICSVMVKALAIPVCSAWPSVCKPGVCMCTLHFTLCALTRQIKASRRLKTPAFMTNRSRPKLLVRYVKSCFSQSNGTSSSSIYYTTARTVAQHVTITDMQKQNISTKWKHLLQRNTPDNIAKGNLCRRTGSPVSSPWHRDTLWNYGWPTRVSFYSSVRLHGGKDYYIPCCVSWWRWRHGGFARCRYDNQLQNQQTALEQGV